MRVGEILVDQKAGVFATVIRTTQKTVVLELMDSKKVREQTAGICMMAQYVPVRRFDKCSKLIRRGIYPIKDYDTGLEQVNGFNRGSTFKVWDNKPVGMIISSVTGFDGSTSLEATL